MTGRTNAVSAALYFALLIAAEAQARPPDPEPAEPTRGEALEASETFEADKPRFRRHQIGSSGFVLFNLFAHPSPEFYQLNYGYRLSPNDTLSVEAITWRYHAPLGIPYGKHYDDPDERYPGSIREFGLGLAYQRVLWKRAYAAVHATPFLRHYLDKDGKRIQSGFQLFMTFRLGYQIQFGRERFFVEPNVAVTTWPLTTNVPTSFRERDDRWPRYFLFEPGLHFGVRL